MTLLLVEVVENTDAAGVAQKLVNLAHKLGLQWVSWLCICFRLHYANCAFSIINLNFWKKVGLVMSINQDYLFNKLVQR